MGISIEHPLGYDARLVARAMAAATGARVHRVSNLADSYWGACKLQRYVEAQDYERRLREVLPMSHVFIGNHPKGRKDSPCKIIRSSRQGGYLLIQFKDGEYLACRASQVRRDTSSASTVPDPYRCAECGDTGPVSLVGGLCADCRYEAEMARDGGRKH